MFYWNNIEREPYQCIDYSLCLFLGGLSYGNTTAKSLPRFVRRSHVSICKWIQNIDQTELCPREKRLINLLQMKLGLKLVLHMSFC
jgi:hypothetical protein